MKIEGFARELQEYMKNHSFLDLVHKFLNEQKTWKIAYEQYKFDLEMQKNQIEFLENTQKALELKARIEELSNIIIKELRWGTESYDYACKRKDKLQSQLKELEEN